MLNDLPTLAFEAIAACCSGPALLRLEAAVASLVRLFLCCRCLNWTVALASAPTSISLLLLHAMSLSCCYYLRLQKLGFYPFGLTGFLHL